VIPDFKQSSRMAIGSDLVLDRMSSFPLTEESTELPTRDTEMAKQHVNFPTLRSWGTDPLPYLLAESIG
jgi:hypothetical protein